MEYHDKITLRAGMIRFLNQRKRAYQLMFDHSGESDYLLKKAAVLYIHTQWSIISKWDYWRHCREVILQEERILSILPSEKGLHKKIRHQVLGMIEHCRRVQKISCYVYRARSDRSETTIDG